MGKKEEFYISIDIEADGPCPLVNSMLQLGAVFYDTNGTVLKEFTVNIQQIEGGVQDPKTMKWWTEQEKHFPGIWSRLMENRVPPKQAMERFQKAVEEVKAQTGKRPVVCAFPAGFDFTWLYCYMLKFLGKSPVGFSAIDLKTLAMSLLDVPYLTATKKQWPQKWRNPKLKHTHDALTDAFEQGFSFFKMMRQVLENNALTDTSTV